MTQLTTGTFLPRRFCLGLGVIAVLSAGALATETVAEEDQPPQLESSAVLPGEEPEEEITWLDVAEEAVGRTADDIAQRLDNFYGEPVDDFARAHSRLRLTVGGSYNDVDKDEYRFKIRGKVDLPKINKRLALVFEGEEGEPFGGQQFDEDDNRAGVQLNVEERNHHRFDLSTNINADLDVRFGVRYRYNRAFSDYFDAQYVQDLAYDTDKKTFTRGRPYLNFLTSENSMLRVLGRWEYGEETDGVEYTAGMAWVYRRGENKAIAPIIYTVGQTDPKQTRNYGVGVRYRTNIYKDFLFMEVIPGYLWKKENLLSDREGSWGIGLYFEMHFEADEEAPYGGRLKILPDSGKKPAGSPAGSQ